MTAAIRTCLALFSAAAILAVVTPRASAAAEPHVLRFADGLDVSTLNPWYATTANIMLLSALTMAKFSRFDRQGRLVPELVSEIPSLRNRGISADGRTVTWHLRRAGRLVHSLGGEEPQKYLCDA
jgi:ABC-type oligopeptide transport system substrate-binding subunit